MNHQQMSRNQRPKVSMIKRAFQYAFFLVILTWLLYQMNHSSYLKKHSDCDTSQSKEENFSRILGRKGDFGSSHTTTTEEIDLYGIDPIKAAENIKHPPLDVDEDQLSGNSNSEGVNSNSFSTTEGEIPIITVSRDEQQEVMKEGVELESFTRMGNVILKKDDSVTVFRFDDENGIPEHESAPSRRSDIQVQSNLLEGNISSSGNKTKEMEVCEELCVKNVARNQSLNVIRRREKRRKHEML